jgi:hypothetical protein
MLRGIRLKLPGLFRAPYYLILALFFLYPVAIVPLLDQPRSEALCWAIFGFSPVAGLIFLTLLPAIRRGRDYVLENGSPWGWAWYPWTLFGVLAFAVAARSALLCWSMHHVPIAETEPYLFGGYFLVPFGLAIAILLLEIGLVEGWKPVILTALVVPAAMLVLTVVGHRSEPTYQWFLSRFIERLGGTPLYLSLLASVGFYAYAVLRRAPAAFDALAAALLALAFVAPQTLDMSGIVRPRAMPILAVAFLELTAGLRRRDGWRCLVGAGCFVASTVVALPGAGLAEHQSTIAFHLVFFAVLALGMAFDDTFGQVFRTTGAVMALLASLAAMTGQTGRVGPIPIWTIELYPLAMCVLIAGYGLVLQDRSAAGSAGLILFVWLGVLFCRGYCSLRQIATGIDYIAIGMVLFAMAVLTSMAKGGILPPTLGARRGK